MSYKKIVRDSIVECWVHGGIGRDGTEKKLCRGRAALLGPAGWVLDVCGRFGERTQICDETNFVRIVPRTRKK